MVKLILPNNVNWRTVAATVLLAFGLIGLANAATSNIRATLHNLSKSGSGTVQATSENQVCVFCHTPHGANTSAKTPLWNRNGSASKTYTRYTSSSLDATSITDGFSAQPGGSSMLCLSCHDGTIALGNVNVLNGKPNQSITLSGTTTTMPNGSYGNTSGFTRNLGGSDGKDLTNDHPISITYNHTLAATDGELRDLEDGSQKDITTRGVLIGLRKSGYKPVLPLEPTGNNGAGQVQCATCHDPHITDDKFLRLKRFQGVTPAGGAFSQANDIICLACHDKLGTTWSQSAHANDTVADETYTATAATLRGFPAGTKVWQAACLNCHDTHTVTGARRLLREGTDDTNSPKRGGKSAIEETCYQCHNTSAKGALTATYTGASNTVTTNVVPDIATEFGRAVRMPITTPQQGGGTATTEVHDITNADFIENPALLGLNDTTKRHAECTDCHNPHRVIRNSLFNGSGDNTRRTHTPATGTNGADGNIASGVLRGMWGVEPTYPSPTTAWPDAPTYTVKKGNPGASTAKDSTYLTREYQLCLKCHSDYSNSTNKAFFPSLGANGSGGTPTGTNGVSKYTNVAAEFAANAIDLPITTTRNDQGENGNSTTYTPGTSGAAGETNGAPNSTPTNHRSWHPVIFPTGRTRQERTGSTTAGDFTNIRPPFNTDANIGKQTMQCSDCHGEATSWTQGTDRFDAANGPNLSKTQGPHGSSKNFLLKGVWDITVKIGDASSGNNTNAGGATICGRCHDPINGKGGFSNGDAAHSKSDHQDLARCMFCHIAVPHGWKNKAFLANLNCLGPEVGKPAGCTNAFNINSGEHTGQLWAAPYYNGSMLRIATWRSSNAWSETSCGPTGGSAGSGWMSGTCQDAKTTQQVQTPALPTTGGY